MYTYYHWPIFVQVFRIEARIVGAPCQKAVDNPIIPTLHLCKTTMKEKFRNIL